MTEQQRWVLMHKVRQRTLYRSPLSIASAILLWSAVRVDQKRFRLADILNIIFEGNYHMRILCPRPLVPLPDLFWISSEQLRLALGRSPSLWRKIDRPYLQEHFPPTQLGPNGIGDARWCLDDISERYPTLASHVAPKATWLDRFKQRQRGAAAAYIGSRKSREVIAA